MSTTNIAKVLKLAAMTTTRRPGSSPVSSSRTISPWGMRSTWRFCWARSLKPWRTFQQEQEEPAVTIRTLSHTLYALLATLTTGRSLRLVQKSAEQERVRGMETVGGRIRAENVGSEFAMLQAVLQPGMSDHPAKFEETWKS